MDVNNDGKIVVLSKAVYEKLYSLACIGAVECGDRPDLDACHRHARKFNTDIKAEFDSYVEYTKAQKRELKEKLRKYVRRYTGKTVYFSPKEHVAIPATIQGIGTDDNICLKLPDDIPHFRNWYPKNKAHIRMEKIQLTPISEGWILIQTGEYKGCYLHHDKILAEKITINIPKEEYGLRFV